jgi:type IV pilus assembly protein PilX
MHGIDAMKQAKANNQAGAVLVISLIILLVMTILGITAMKTSNLELVMSTNIQEQVRAMVDAENTLADGENDVRTNFPGAYSYAWHNNTTDGLYAQNDPANLDLANSALEDVDWEDPDNDGEGYVAGPNGRYAIEYMGNVLDTSAGASATIGTGTPKYHYVYRVTARGTTGRGATRFVQSIFGVLN